jgi:hypothetical protein
VFCDESTIFLLEKHPETHQKSQGAFFHSFSDFGKRFFSRKKTRLSKQEPFIKIILGFTISL